MKVKVFSEKYTGDSIQEKINKWLEFENPSSIEFIKQSESMTGDDNDGSFNLTISIWYTPKSKPLSIKSDEIE